MRKAGTMCPARRMVMKLKSLSEPVTYRERREGAERGGGQRKRERERERREKTQKRERKARGKREESKRKASRKRGEGRKEREKRERSSNRVVVKAVSKRVGALCQSVRLS